MSFLVREQNQLPLPPVQRTEDAEISGNTATSSPKTLDEVPTSTVSVPDDSSIAYADNESEPKVVESQKISS